MKAPTLVALHVVPVGVNQHIRIKKAVAHSFPRSL